MLTYPVNELNEPDKLLSILGNFWTQTFGGAVQVEDLITARGALDFETHLQFLELIASISRFKIPVFHRENWFFLLLNESDKNQSKLNRPHYDGQFHYSNAPEIVYDQLISTDLFQWDIPADLKAAKTILNRITEATANLTDGIDFQIQDGVISFVEDPFASDKWVTREIFENNQLADRQIGMWVYGGEFDWRSVYIQFGYAIGLALQSSESYKLLTNAIYDCLVEGTSIRAFQQFFTAITDIPVVEQDGEIVETIFTQSTEANFVLTDKNVYRLHKDSEITVSVGDVLASGQTLSDGLEFIEFNDGTGYENLSYLSVGYGMLDTGYLDNLVFENKIVPVQLTYDVNGKARIEFEIGGFALDVERFWNAIHEKGIAEGETLANLLDTRENPFGEPTALALPSQINPLQFLVANVLRFNAFAVRIKPHLFGPNALGLESAFFIRKLIPPHTLCLILVDMKIAEEEYDPIAIEESLTLVPIQVFSDTIDTESISEKLRFRQVEGRCA